MKHIVVFGLCAMFGSVTWAQENPTQVTDEQIAVYQRGIEAGCKDAGRRRGDPVERVDAFCSCVLKVLVAELARAEWQQAFFSSLRRDPQGEEAVMAPHFEKVGACRSAP